MSARSRAFPWWGERRVPHYVNPDAPLPDVEPAPLHLYFDRAGAGFREAWTSRGADLFGRPVFFVEREETLAGVRIRYTAGPVTIE